MPPVRTRMKHHFGVYDVKPKDIRSMSLEPTSKRLAVCREGATIEVWDVAFAPHVAYTIVGNESDSFQAVAWCKKRLFSVGFNSTVVEHDTTTLLRKGSVQLLGGPAWCIDVNDKETTLAVGTDDGYVNIINVLDEPCFDRVLNKAEGRLLCLAFSPNDEIIAAGSTNCVFVWNVRAGSHLHRLETGQISKTRDTLVWSIAIADDLTIITGDSRGKLSFWNGKVGALRSVYNTHGADILCIALAKSTKYLYCAGVDPLIIRFEAAAMAPDGEVTWLRTRARRVSGNDIRALAMDGPYVYSGGADAYLTVNRWAPDEVIRYPPFMQPPRISVGGKCFCIMVQHERHLEVWRIRPSQRAPTGARRDSHFILSNDDKPLKLFHINSHNRERITCSAMSDDGNFLAYSTVNQLRVFRTYLSQLPPEAKRLKSVNSPGYKMVFTSDGRRLVIATYDGDLDVLLLCTDPPIVVRAYKLHPCKKDAPTITVKFLLACPNSDHVMLSTVCGVVYVIQINSDSDQAIDNAYFRPVPLYRSTPTAMAIHPTTHNMIIVFSDHKIVEYDLKNKRLTPFTRGFTGRPEIPMQWQLQRFWPIVGVFFDPESPELVFLHTEKTLYCILKDIPALNIDKDNSTAKRQCTDNSEEDEDTPTLTKAQIEARATKASIIARWPQDPRPANNFTDKVVMTTQYIVHASWLQHDHFLCVEVSPETVLKHLPDTYFRKMFGT